MNTRTMAYIGQRLTDKGTLKPFYQDTASGEVRGFKNRLTGTEKIGTIVEVTDHPEGGWYIGGEHAPVVIGSRSVEDAAVWAGQEAADRVLHARGLQQKRLIADQPEPFKDAIAVLREAYRGTTGIARRGAFIDYINAAIQS